MGLKAGGVQEVSTGQAADVMRHLKCGGVVGLRGGGGRTATYNVGLDGFPSKGQATAAEHTREQPSHPTASHPTHLEDALGNGTSGMHTHN